MEVYRSNDGNKQDGNERSRRKMVESKGRLVGRRKDKSISFEDRRTEVLTVAARLFNQHGYHKTTLDQIANALKVTKPALYYYAKSKEELLNGIFMMADQTARELTSASDESADSAAQLRHFVDQWTATVCSDFGRCLLRVNPTSLQPATRKLRNAANNRIRSKVRDLVEAGIKDGTLTTTDPSITTNAILDLFGGIARWYEPDRGRNLEEILDQYWHMLSPGFVTHNAN